MSAPERCWVLLSTELSDGLKPLKTQQLLGLRRRMQERLPQGADTPLSAQTVSLLEYPQEQTAQLLALLSRQAAFDDYLWTAEGFGISAISCFDEAYPTKLLDRLGTRAPAVLYCRGAVELLSTRCVSLVGSRRLRQPGAAFARRVGSLAASEGFTLVSGNAAGADCTAQDASLATGGCVISVLADRLSEHEPTERTLCVSEGGWHQGFSAARALHRNTVIHALGDRVFVAQTDCGKGGTWRGTAEALFRGLGPVYVHADGSAGAADLCARGATAVRLGSLKSLTALPARQENLFEKGLETHENCKKNL